MTFSNKLHFFWAIALSILLFASPVKAVEPSLTFSPSVLNVQGDSEIIASVILNTGGQGVSGAGVRINFDPYYLSAIRIHPSDIFADYPASIIDNEHGKITISGIASSPTDLYNGEGTFADIVFRPYHSGTSKVNFIFTPGDTTDSNIAVMTGNGDILSSVNELTVNITAANGGGASTEIPTPTPTSNDSTIISLINSQNETIKRIASTLGLSKIADQYATARPGRTAITEDESDPLAPLVRQDPITDPSTTQPIASTTGAAKTAPPSYLIPSLLVLILILLGIVIWFILSRRNYNRELPPPPSSPPVSPPALTYCLLV